MKLRFWLVALLFSPVLAQASTGNIRSRLEELLLHKVMTVRGFYQDKSLTFSSDGTLLSAGTPGYANSDGEIEVDKVEISKNGLILSGTLPVLCYDLSMNSIHYIKVLGKRKVEIKLANPLHSADEVGPMLFKVFYSPGEMIGDCPADEAARYELAMQKAENKNANPMMSAFIAIGKVCGLSENGVHKIGGKVQAPRAVYDPEPHYPEEARRKRIQGVVMLRILLTPDGKAESILVTRPRGYGLDEEAAYAVRSWKFEPATLDGKPVPVVVNIEVNFHLY